MNELQLTTSQSQRPFSATLSRKLLKIPSSSMSDITTRAQHKDAMIPTSPVPDPSSKTFFPLISSRCLNIYRANSHEEGHVCEPIVREGFYIQHYTKRV